MEGQDRRRSLFHGHESSSASSEELVKDNASPNSVTHSLTRSCPRRSSTLISCLPLLQYNNSTKRTTERPSDRADGHREDNNKTETSTSVSSVPPPVHLPTQTMRNLPPSSSIWLVSFYYSATSQNTRILLAFLRHAITTTTTHTTLARCAVHAAAA